ncbi:hypothetical protein [uncultured Microbulbifer sp.]|uniref:hypothetical protein n=1 Tax=uncultured Microbulbifer sp. TaxID=348147 RepID=UPI0026277352|nr:hypothetical protein [uncultured Microbulbifer sp.]
MLEKSLKSKRSAPEDGTKTDKKKKRWKWIKLVIIACRFAYKVLEFLFGGGA